MKAAVVTIVPAPYRDSLFSCLAGKVKLKVFFQTVRQNRGWDMSDTDAYPHEFTRSVSLSLQAFSPDVVLVYGYSYRNAQQALWWALRNNVPLLMRSDSNISDELLKPLYHRMLKRMVLSRLASRIKIFLTIGARNEAYWEYYGVPRSRMIRARYTVDVEYFRSEAERVRERKKEIYTTFSLPPLQYITYAGRLVQVKGVDVLIRAFLEIAPMHEEAGLLICGDGPERASLERLAGGFLGRRIFFTGTVPRRALPRIFSISKLFVLPSRREPWGLVVNEAMAAGVPCVVSDVCGCVDDLIEEKVTGWTFQNESASRLSEVLVEALASNLEEMARNAQKKSCAVTPADNARVFEEAFGAALR